MHYVEKFIEKKVKQRPVNVLTEKLINETQETINEVKKLTKELREAQEEAECYSKMLESVIDAMPGIVWGKKADGTFFLTNKNIRDTLLDGASKQEALSMSGESAARVSKKGDTLHLDCKKSDEEVLRTKKAGTFIERGLVNGRYVVYRTTKAPFFDINGNLIGTVGFGREITRDCKIINDSIAGIDTALSLCEGRCRSSKLLAESLIKVKEIVADNYGTVCDVEVKDV
jgi:PAS domain-containing protein